MNARLRNEPAPADNQLDAVNDQLIGYVVETLFNRMQAAELLKNMKEAQQPRDVKKG